MQIVEGCERYLGWQPPAAPENKPWVPYSAAVGQLKRVIASGKVTAPRNATVANLALALEYSRRRQLPLNSPVGLLYRIEDALALAHIEKPVSDIKAEVDAAVQWEKFQDDEHSLRWIYRLVRSTGDGRAKTLAEWREAGRG